MSKALIITEDGQPVNMDKLPDPSTLALWTYAYTDNEWFWVVGTGKKFHDKTTWDWVPIEKVYVPKKFQMLALVML